MNRWIRRTAITLGLLALAAGSAVLLGEHLAQRRAERKVDVAVQAVAYRSDATALARGRYLFNSRGCVDCHGAAGGGRTLVDDGQGLHIAGPNLTMGNPALAAYAEVDWVRSIRHGVAPGGRPLRVMPSEDYNRLTDEDLASLVAYIRKLAPVQGGAAVVELPLPVRAFYGFGLMHDAAAKIDHALPPAQPVADGVNVAHGAYVANMCLGCHGAKLAGGKIPGAPPDWPPAAKLTPASDSAMPRYPDADAFARMFKTGNRPDGTPIKVMPFGSLGQMNDTDVRALFLYLKTLPSE
jgi:mono/diheme cytochrome c family protein